MVRVFVFYDSKYGNTKLAAEKIAEGMRTIGGVDAEVGYIKKVNVEQVVGYDAILLGAPNHMGRPSRSMKQFINRLAALDLRAKNVAVFGTYSGRARSIDRSVKKLVKTVEEKLPNLRLLSHTLSVRVNGVKGPIMEGELPKCIDFGKKLLPQLSKPTDGRQ